MILIVDAFDNGLSDVMGQARDAGVEEILCVSVSLETFPDVLNIAKSYANVVASVGVHPSENGAEPTVDKLIELGQDPLIVAVGETGLDYHYDFVSPEVQRTRFACHVEAAKALDKPLIIHTREAREDTIAILREGNAEQVGGVMHCFTETLSMAEQAMDLGFYISFSGIITFKNADELREVVKAVPLERILIETDAPYLTPVPKRGKANYPAYVRYVAEKVAQIKELSLEQVAIATTSNYHKLFRSN